MFEALNRCRYPACNKKHRAIPILGGTVAASQVDFPESMNQLYFLSLELVRVLRR
jgi:hypothetical protein